MIALDEALGRIGLTVAEAEADARRPTTTGESPQARPNGRRPARWRAAAVKIAHSPSQLERQPRAVAIGTFDGVHRGHRSVIRAAIDSGLAPTVITFDPHPRIALGNHVELICTLERRLELFAEVGAEAALVASFTTELMSLEPEVFAERYLRAIGAEAVAAGADFRFGSRRRGDLELLDRLGFAVLEVEMVPEVSSSGIRRALQAGDPGAAAGMLGRPYELDGLVVAGDQRGGTLGYPTANLALEPHLACPRYGIYAGAALGHRAAVSIGTNPHYGGTERRIEPFLLDFEGDLYGKRLVVELWERLRDEATFATEEELVTQIGLDVEATRRAVRPARSPESRDLCSCRTNERLGIEDADRRSGGERVHLGERLAEVAFVGLPGDVPEVRRRENRRIPDGRISGCRFLVTWPRCCPSRGPARCSRRSSCSTPARPGSPSWSDGEVVVHEWLKYAMLLLFRLSHMETIELGPFEYADKIPLKRHFQRSGVRVVPGRVGPLGLVPRAGRGHDAELRQHRRARRRRHDGRHLGHRRFVRADRRARAPLRWRRHRRRARAAAGRAGHGRRRHA